MLTNRSSRGQAIILIVFAIIGLVAFTALAIDGGVVFADRRAAQSAADNAALRAALSIVDAGPYTTDGLAIANSNGYPNNGGTVGINYPPGASCNGSNGPYAGDDGYVQVIIYSNVNTFFAPVIGINQMHNCVEAIAKATKATYTPFALGNAIAAMDCTTKNALKVGGNSTTLTLNGGVLSNSDNSISSFFINKIDNLTIQQGFGISTVGDNYDLPPGYPSPVTKVEQTPCPLPDFWYPTTYTCDITGTDFPDDFNLLTIENGVEVYRMATDTTYCVTGDFKQPNKVLNGDNVHIVLINNGIHWNGNAEIHLSAASDPLNPLADPLNGILIYLPRPNSNPIILNGSSGSTISGTIFAPNSDITLNGDFTGTEWESQIIGKTADLTGAQNLTINYLGGRNGGYVKPPELELTK